jgi:AAA domain
MERGWGEMSAAHQTGPQETLQSAPASSFKMAAHHWLWPDRFAIGELGIIAGMPDKGKGLITCYIAANVTHGSMWPFGKGRAPQGKVIMLSAEDDPSRTIVPRLKAAGADLDRVEIVGMVTKPSDFDRMFNLAEDLDLLRQKVCALGDVKLILIDPISAYLGVGKVNSYRTTDVRAVLAPLVAFAEELKIAIIGVMHFNKKSEDHDVVARISDSLAFAATARHVFAAVDDLENNRRLFVKGKNNIAKSDIKTLAYGIKTRIVGNDKDTGEDIVAPCIDWLEEVDISASEAMQAAASKTAGALGEAKQFLQDFLKNGPVLQTDVEAAATADGISGKTLQRAKKALGVVSKKDGPDGKWRWQFASGPSTYEPSPADL